jgi:transposase
MALFAMVKWLYQKHKNKGAFMQFASLTNEDSTTILLGLYDVVWDFHQALLRKLPPSLPAPDHSHPPTKKTKLPLVMLVALILFKFFTGHRSWKDYYRYLKSHHDGVTIGSLPNYKNFMKNVHALAGYAVIFLEVVRKYCKHGVKLQFADSTKLHLVVDKDGQVLAWRITTATMDDRKGLALVWHELTGMIVADAGYLGANWQEAATELHLTLMAGAKKVMKKLMSRWQHVLLKARQRVETTFSVLKLRLGIETSLPRSVMGFFSHYVWCLLAYQLRRMGQLEQRAKQALITEGVA